MTLSDIPLIKGFTVRMPQPYSENVVRFLDSYVAAKQAAGSGEKRLMGGEKEGIKLMVAGQVEKLDGIKKDLSRLTELARVIEDSRRYNSQEKRDKLDRYYLLMDQLATIGNRVLEKIRDRKK